MEEDPGTTASAVGRYQVAWALGCGSYYSCGRPHNNDEIILTRNDAGVFTLAPDCFSPTRRRKHHKAGLNAQLRLLLSSFADLLATVPLCRSRADTTTLYRCRGSRQK